MSEKRDHRTAHAAGPIGAWFRSVVDAAGSLVLEGPLPLLVGLLFVGILAKCWWGVYPALSLELGIAERLPSNPQLPAEAQYLMSSLGGPVLARLFGVGNPLAFVIMHAVVLVVAVTLMVFLVRRRFGTRASRLALLALCLTQAPTLLLNWLGSYDVFTFLLTTTLVLVSTWPITLLVSVLLGILHFEQGLFVGLGLAALIPQRYVRQPRFAASLFGGLLLGKLLLALYLASVGVTSGRLSYLIIRGVTSTFRMPVGVVPIWIYALLGGAWVWIAVIALRPSRGSGQLRRGLLILAAMLIPTVLTFDQTRVFSLISWPIILAMTLLFDHGAEEADVRFLAGCGFLAFLVFPAVFVWEGAARFPLDYVPGGATPQVAVAVLGLVLVATIRARATPAR